MIVWDVMDGMLKFLLGQSIRSRKPTSRLLALTADDAAAIRKVVAPGCSGLIKVEVCPTCAMPACVGTDVREPNRVEATLADKNCEGCVDFGERHPAVFRWVTWVIEGQKLLNRWRTTP